MRSHSTEQTREELEIVDCRYLDQFNEFTFLKALTTSWFLRVEEAISIPARFPSLFQVRLKVSL